MQHCVNPIPLGYLKGQPPGVNPTYGRRMRNAVACGRCKACCANRKMDWSGRLLAESLFSSDVIFATFTYKEEPERFRYSDIQTMLTKMRHDVRYYGKNTIRFFCVGEKGTLKNRRHWHALLFFSAPSGIERWGRETNPGQLWEHWPHGWADIQPLPSGQYLRAIRYCAKYALKDIDRGRGVPELYPCKSSLRPAIGDAFFRDLADRMAKAGVAPDGKYQHHELRWQRGRKKGELVDFSMTHATRYNFINYYRKAWMRHHGNGDELEFLALRQQLKYGLSEPPDEALFYEGRPVPMTDWLMAFDDSAISKHMRSRAG